MLSLLLTCMWNNGSTFLYVRKFTLIPLCSSRFRRRIPSPPRTCRSLALCDQNWYRTEVRQLCDEIASRVGSGCIDGIRSSFPVQQFGIRKTITPWKHQHQPESKTPACPAHPYNPFRHDGQPPQSCCGSWIGPSTVFTPQLHCRVSNLYACSYRGSEFSERGTAAYVNVYQLCILKGNSVATPYSSITKFLSSIQCKGPVIQDVHVPER